MVKGIKLLKTLLITITVAALSLVVYGFYTVPDELYCVSFDDLQTNGIYTISYKNKAAANLRSIGTSAESRKYEVNVSLFNSIPVKTSSLTISERKYVVPSGEIFGLRLYTQGVVVIKTDTVDTSAGYASPAEKAKLQKGDIILKVNGEYVTSSNSLSLLFCNSGGASFEIEYLRDSKAYKTTLTTLYSESENKYKAGLWIRDSAAGIGTMTFYCPESGLFASLGHGVCDVDTGEILPFSNGDTVKADICGCYKGENGKAGELCGTFLSEVTGILFCNCSEGVYGKLSDYDKSQKVLPLAMSYEVEEGNAQIISSVDNEGAKYYDIEITKLSDTEEKNMVIKITDEELIKKTGGIVQGMSGSPIIQNGMLVGAVTHVFLGDPTQGYAIFAQTMLEKLDETAMAEAS